MRGNNTFKRIMFILITVFILNFTVISIYAESKNIDAKLYSNVSSLVGGQELQVTLKLDQYKNINKGLNAYKAKLEYDKDVFENVSKNNFLSLNNWEMLEFNEKTGEFVAIKKNGSTEPEEVVKIRLKTKNNIKSGNSIIKVKEIVTSEGKKDLFANNESVTVSLVGNNNTPSVPVEPNQPINPTDTTKTSESISSLGGQTTSKNTKDSNNNEENVVASESINENDNNSKDSSEVKNNKKSSSKDKEDENIPETNKKYIFIFLIIIAGICFLIFFINKDDDDDDDNKKKTRKTMMFILIGVLSLQFVSTVKAAFYDFSKKGEVNGDNKVNYDDVKYLENHLINSKKIENIYLENADMNSDGSITVTDLTLLVQKLEKTLDYEVKLSKLEQENKFVSKDSDVSLVFRADVSYGAKIKRVKINDTYYDVVEDSLEKGKYKVVVKGFSKPGIKEYNFTEVLLNNDKKIKVDLTESIDVLKNKPIIKNYNVSEDFSNSTMNISFDLADEDSAITASNVYIMDESGKIVKETEIEEGYNSIKIKVLEGKIYKVKFLINYNLTSDKNLIDSTGTLVGNVNFDKDLQLIVDYNFNVGNFTTSGTTFGRGEDIKIFFDSTNSTNYIPEKVRINGKNYNVSIENNKYAVVIPGLDKFGNNIINIEGITLNNGKSFEIKDKNKITVNIIKSAPSISDFVLEENTEKDVIDVKFKVNNDDNSLLDLVINLTDSNNTLIEQIKLSKDDLNGTKNISKSFKNASQVSNYKVSVVANYNQTDKAEDLKENVVLMQKEFTIAFKAVIRESSSNKSYYEKGEDVLLTYDIATNSSKNITKIRINNRDYPVEKISDGKYQVIYKSFTKSGIETINTTKVICEDGTEADIFDTRKIEILKDAPKISEYKQNLDTKDSKAKISFNLDDIDNSFISGKIIFTNNSDGSVIIKEIKIGKNSFEFDVKDLNAYMLNINVTYNRDSNNDSNNKVVDQTILTKEISGSTDYKLVVENLKVTKNNKESNYFDKNEAFNIEFESTNISDFDVSEVTINGKNYKVTKVGKVYEVALPGYSKAGSQTLIIEKVKLSNSKELEVNSNNKAQIEVLKDSPKISNFKQVDDEKNSKTTISFDLDDSDNSLVSANIILTNKGDGKSVTKAVQKGKNSFEFDIMPFNSYTLDIKVTYDRDSKVDSINNFANQTLLSKEISGSFDYNLTINNLRTTKNNTESKYFDKYETINIDFESTNVSNYDIAQVIVNDKVYPVSKLGNIYRIVLPGYSKAGVQSLTINKIKLSNSKELEVNSNNKVQIEVLKDAPKVSNFKQTDDEKNSKTTISFDLDDSDNSLVSGEAVLINKNDSSVVRKEIKKGKNTLEFNIKALTIYTLNINVTYDRDSKEDSINKVTNQTLITKEITGSSDYKLVVSNIKATKNNKETKYFEKNEAINIDFESTNVGNYDISEVTINGNKYAVSKVGSVYRVALAGYSKAGNRTLTIEKVKLSNSEELEVNSNNKVQIEVLKDAPKISNFKQTDDEKNSKTTISFDLDDSDSSLVSGEVVLINKNDSSVVRKEIKKGKNNLEFNIKALTTYTLNVNVTYDRDSKEDSINKVTNRTLITKEITGSSDYKLVVSNIKATKNNKETKYFEKNEAINIDFESTNVVNYDISEVTINGNKYAVTKVGNVYKVVLAGYSKAGNQTLTIEKVKLSNSKELEVNSNNKVQIEVLKSKPVINNYKVVEDINDSNLTISFDIVDPDNSIVDSSVKFIDANNEVVKTVTPKIGANTVKLSVEDGKKYKVKFDIKYNLTSEDKPTDTSVVGTISQEKELQLNINYNFVADNFKTYNDKNEETTLFNKDQDIKIMFTSSNATTHEVSKIKINGKDYNVTKENNFYVVNILGIDKAGLKAFNIDKITLDNGKEFEVKKTLNINIIKDIPTVTDLNLVENTNNDQVNVDFTINDDDKALLGITAKLFDNKGNVLEEIQLTDKEIADAGEISKVFKRSFVSKYKVSVIGSYSQTDNTGDIKNVVLSEKEIEAIARAEILELVPDKIYYEKGSNVNLTYSINTNKSDDITKITINNKDYAVQKLSNGKYQVIYKNDTTSGVKTLKTTKLTYSNGQSASVNTTVKIEVLKSAPRIANLKQDDDIENSKVIYSFDILDDDSFLNGKLIVTKVEDNSICEFNIKKGHNEIEIPVEYQTAYKANILISYDLDTNELTDNANKYDNVSLKELDIVLLSDYEFTLTNVNSYKNQLEAKDFLKDEKIAIGFDSSNVTNFEPTSVKINGKVYRNVEKINNRYYVTIDNFDEFGTHKVNIEEVILSNGKYFTLTENNSVSVNILRRKPSLSDFSYVENVKDDNINLKFNLKDDDNALSALEIILLDDSNKEISKISMPKEELKTSEVSKTLATSMSEKYKVKVNATYKKNQESIEEVLLEQAIPAQVRATIKSVKSNKKNYAKNENIILTYQIQTNQKGNISKIMMNGVEYPATKLENGDYQIIVKAPVVSGDLALKTTKVIFQNNKEKEVTNTTNIGVLKNAPTIVNENITEDILNSQITYSFDILDEDDAFLDGEAVVTKEEDNKTSDYEIQKGHNSLTIPVDDGKKYKVNILANYNLSSDSKSEEFKGKLTLEKNLLLNIDYQFSLEDIKSYKEDIETSEFLKNEKIVIGFESSNATKFEPVSAKINGKVYENIETIGNRYYITIDGFDKFGSHKVTIEELTLENGKSFILNENNEISVNVVQEKPSISDFLYTENTKDDNIKLDFKLKDDNNALSSLEIVLLDVNDNQISKTSLSKEELKLSEISKTLSTSMTEKYKVIVNAIYKKNQENIEEVLFEQEIIAKAKAKIKAITSNKNYYAKEEAVNLIYQIETNRGDSLTKIVVNNVDYATTKLENDKYQITVKAPSKSGIVDLKTTKIVFNNNEEVSLTNTKKIEVLKNIPTIVFGNNVEDVENNKIIHSFEIVDEDNSFISGKVVVTKLEDNTTREFNIKNGLNELEIPVEYMKEYMAAVHVTYDLDTNELTENENKYENVKLSEHSLELHSSYEFNVNNIKTYNDKNEETKYFSKNEAITVRFESSNKTKFKPTQAVIAGKTYDVTEVDGKYETQITGYSEVGVKTIKLEKIILENTHEEELKDTFKVEILKDKPTASNYVYEEKTSGDISVKFSVSDSEKTITSGKVFILEDNTNLKEQALVVGNNTITFTPKSEKSYVVKVIADYDLDSNKLGSGSNEYKNTVLLENEINLGRRQFQIKDIVSSTVYMQTDEGIKEASSFNVSDLTNLDNFVVKVRTRDMATFYTTIEEYRVDNNKLKLTLKYDDVVQYNGSKKQNKLEIEYGNVKNGAVENTSLELLIKKIKANPSGDFELTQDYDASFISGSDATLVTEKFTGTLNGNGYKITNLNKPFFNELEGATIKNIVFSNVKLSGANSHGTIANIATDTTVTNVHIKGLNYTTGANHSAGMIGEGINTNVEKSSVTGFVITTSGHVRVSAIIGKLTDGSIKNCYVQGSINSTQAKDGNGIGGLLGHGFGVETIENCISKITITNNQGARLNGAVVGLFMNNSSVLKNNVSLSEGENFYSVYGNGNKATITNNYELKDSGLSSNAADGKVTVISKEDINSSFYKNRAKFDETVWDLSGTSYDKLPVLKNADPNSIEDESDNASIYIPDYNRLKKVTGYKKSKEILYHNIYKLMPYYDAKYLIEDSNKIANDNVLATKAIRHILPYSNGKLLTYFTSENYNTITDIKVVFDDFNIGSYKVNFKELNQNISIYDIEGLGIDYAPNKYIIKNNSSIVETIKAYIEGVDYATVLDPLTAAADARHYRDNYNENMKTSALNIALQLLQNDDENVLTINNAVLNNKIKEQLIDGGRLNKIIYAYNYYNKWYNFEIGGAKVADILLFENEMYKDNNNFENLINEVLVGNIAVGATDGFFNSNVAKYTGSSRLQYFLDYLITNIGGYEDVNDWFTEYFGSRNFLAEFGVDNRPELLYRGWYQLKKNSRMILPVITMPSDSTYMISGPAHLQFGPAQLYNKDTVTDAGKKVVRDVINNHVTLAKRHFTVLAAGFGSLKWNNYCIMCYDCTKIITGYRQGTITIGGVTIPTGKIVPVYTQGRVGLNYAFFKNFSEVLGLWQPAGSSGGVGNSAGFLWFQAQPGLTNYDTWTHEFEHALYDKIMLDQRGFRTRMEIMTQGNIEQRDDWSANNLNQDVGPYYFNTSFYLNKEGNATQNLSPDRIDTKEEMENYFKGQQNALDLLDYIEGKAFIKLTPEQQAKIATRVASASERTAWGTITTEQASQMNLTSLESLYDNQIILRPPNAWGASVRGLVMPGSTVADNYGYESVWVNRWYIDHYDSRFAGAFGTKRNLFEMLGYAGVEGYIIYGSGRSGNDLDAIRKITQLVTGTAMNWREYKMSRYATVEENLNNNKYIDAEYMIQRFTEALINDANNGDRNVSQRTNLRKIYYHYLKSATNDFIDDPLGSTVEVNHIKTADELVQKINAKPYGYYVLDNDIDFSNMTKNVTQTFMGRLDGNGHKIIGNKLPIFNKIRYGYVGNIEFKDTDIPKNISNAGALSYRAEMSTVEKINVKNLQMNFAGRNDLSLIGGAVSNVITRDCAVEKLTHHISNVDDFATLNEDAGGIFIIDNDIDFSGKTYNGAVISNIFTGKIDGQGHTLSNLENASFFADFRGTVENLNINNVNINSSVNNVGAFAKQSSAAILKNMKLHNINLTGASNVGGVVGTDNRGSTFERISVNNLNISSTGMFVGGIVGSQYGGSVANVYVEGEINLLQFGAGGIIGATGNGTAVTINNSIANVGINKTGDTDNQHRKNNAGLVGFIADVSKLSAINNSIAFGNMVAFNDDMIPNKFIYTTEDVIKSKLLKCYEVSEAIGGSSVSANTVGHLDNVTRNNLTIDFYKNLGFDASIWNLDTISSKGYPVLK